VRQALEQQSQWRLDRGESRSRVSVPDEADAQRARPGPVARQRCARRQRARAPARASSGLLGPLWCRKNDSADVLRPERDARCCREVVGGGGSCAVGSTPAEAGDDLGARVLERRRRPSRRAEHQIVD
jgi:hypothetical protein